MNMKLQEKNPDKDTSLLSEACKKETTADRNADNNETKEPECADKEENKKLQEQERITREEAEWLSLARSKVQPWGYKTMYKWLALSFVIEAVMASISCYCTEISPAYKAFFTNPVFRWALPFITIIYTLLSPRWIKLLPIPKIPLVTILFWSVCGLWIGPIAEYKLHIPYLPPLGILAGTFGISAYYFSVRQVNFSKNKLLSTTLLLGTILALTVTFCLQGEPFHYILSLGCVWGFCFLTTFRDTLNIGQLASLSSGNFIVGLTQFLSKDRKEPKKTGSDDIDRNPEINRMIAICIEEVFSVYSIIPMTIIAILLTVIPTFFCTQHIGQKGMPQWLLNILQWLFME